jgi:hypothetical protein
MSFQVSPIISILVFIAIAGGVGAIFYFRIMAVKESNKVLMQFESLAKKMNLTFTKTNKVGNELFPMLSGSFKDRNIVIERRLEDKYKYFVVSLYFQNMKNNFIQIIPKNHLGKNQKDNYTQTVLTGDNTFDSKYLLLGSDEKQAKVFIETFFKDFSERYTQILPFFSTFVIFQDRLTMVIASSGTKLKYDSVLEEIAKTLYEWANALEENP